MFGKVAITAVVGNEDGAHAIIADAFQGLNDIGFSIPAQGATYWNHEAMNPKDYKDLEETPRPSPPPTAPLPPTPCTWRTASLRRPIPVSDHPSENLLIRAP